jgi:hypothetical protein
MEFDPEITEDRPLGEIQPEVAKRKKTKRRSPKRRRVVILVLTTLAIILVGGAAGALFGYNSGVRTRVEKYESQVALITTTQYQLALQDQMDGRVEMARKRLEYIIQLDPTFPGATQVLSEVMLEMALQPGGVAEPVIPMAEAAPTPGMTPTPDLRGAEELFTNASQLLQAGQWANAIEVLGALRKANQSYRAVEVDGMYYIALRQRGLDKILREGNLEGGLYDLALMERFGPLDSEAQNYRIWSRYYITGASFWKVDWAAVVNNFAQVYPSLPNLRDGSGWTATERYRIALVRFGEQLMNAEQWCDAEYQFNQALAISPDVYLDPTATYVYDKCHPPEETEEPPAQAAPPQATP